MSDERRGMLCGIGAYTVWGLFPLYWPLLRPAGSVEILAHRMAWSLLIVLGILAIRRRWAVLAPTLRSRRRMALLALAAIAISANWVVYIWGVNHGHVVETSLGYFINPIVTVMFGVLIFRERLRPGQWLALGLGGGAVIVLTAAYGRPPWIALTLACSFGSYGLLKKTVGIGAVESLSVETAVVFLPAVVYLAALDVRGQGTFGHGSAGHSVLLAGAGAVTVVPLLLFGAAATRVPLSTMGLLQYLTPCMQFGLGVAVFGEAVPPVRLVGFGLVWMALAVLSADALRTGRRRARTPIPHVSDVPVASEQPRTLGPACSDATG